ncbi:crotonobetainyl-CoA:carnitine CoA-transferase CaiB-like acyl-CoA transferase [Caulobacter ginsengisoli]|uniref:Crotonobetainyl-CoA:carnitine CoA-transferase CaiB-like acyl-CoA transferase n=1 Tax=Caulobacter ginsengisoli TaxID=400775 RepID=A0ABU0IY19_9CAUL|nr:CoA transferase [Caulobacter ginsengisoli]MDQ0466900.1 crotonobetainyl-CoA:carnitine CoA-transferase CaiB-like acyl-CoA transferase [Caulobacter ginsengisoli]
MAPPYAGLRVIELSDDPGGDHIGRLLAEMGALVIKLEPPGGSPARAVGPFAGGVVGPETSLNFRFYNGDKQSVVADVATPAGLAVLHGLCADADIFISTLQPAALAAIGLDLEALRAANPWLIVLSVTAFGLTGPWADYKSSDLVALAAGGPLNSCGYDDHSIPPIRPGGNQGYHSAASFAHIGLLLALLERQRSGVGQLVDVSMHEACAVNIELANPYWFYPRINVQRQTCRHAQPSPTQSALFRSADDRYVYFALILSDPKAWASLVDWMEEKGMAADLADPAYADLAYRQAQFPEIQSLVECFFLIQTAEEAYHEGQAHGLPIGVLNAPEDLFEDEHLKARGFWVEVEEADGARVKYPGPSYVFSAFAAVPRRRAPMLGEHTDEVLARLSEAGS